MNDYITVPIPDSRRQKIEINTACDDVASLCRLLIGAVAMPSGLKLTYGQIAVLLGVSESALKSWRVKPAKRGRKPNNARTIPYSALYCLQALTLNPQAVAKALADPEAAP